MLCLSVINLLPWQHYSEFNYTLTFACEIYIVIFFPVNNYHPLFHLKEDPLIFVVQFSSVQSLSSVQLFATPWIAAHQASLSITNSRSLSKLMSIESVMPSNHVILCRPLLLLPPIPPSIRVFSNESALHMRWPKYLLQIHTRRWMAHALRLQSY